MPDTRKDKLALAFDALNDAKEDMTEDELREMLNRRLQSAVPSKKRIMPTMSKVEVVPPEVYEEGELRTTLLPQYGNYTGNAENLPAVEGGTAKRQALPYVTRKKSKLYEMMQ
jgi:hypothetical protein